MSALKAGDDFPEGVTFTYVPYNPDQGAVTACGIPVKYDASKGNSLPTPLLSFFFSAPVKVKRQQILTVNYRIQGEEGSPRLRPRRLHAHLPEHPHPRLHREATPTQGRRCRPGHRHLLQ